MYLNGVLLVEGKDDESLIKSFLKCYIFKTNGYDLKKEDIAFYKELSKRHNIIVLTDPESAGEKIRKVLNDEIKNTINVFLNVDKCNKNNKHGVAESNKDHILEQLKEYLSNTPIKVGNLTPNDLSKLGLNGDSNAKEKRRYICDKFSLGVCNQKNMLKRLNLLNIKLEDIKEALDCYGD